ncbi:MAG: ABC transporter permease [Eubacteriales bacterium]|nr:ABC transporter permease [Eubacteriales bacterium]MDY4899128.1 ABC transporter permease [Eubacteriales bacterium]
MQFLSALPGTVAQGLIWGIMAIGVYITYKILDIADLTVDGSICTGSAVCTMLIINGCPVGLAMLIATLSGVAAGLITGMLHITFGIPAILSGILTQLVLWSVNLKIMGRANQALSARNYSVLISQMNLTSAILILGICAALLVALLYVFFGTELGCSIRATGINAAMSRAQGIHTDVTKLIGLALSNGIVAFAGALLCQYQGYSDINMGRGAVVIGLAAVVIGEAIISKLPQNFAIRLSGVLLGAVVYYIVYQIIILIGLDTDLLKMFSAIVVAVFLGLPYIKGKIAERRKYKKEDETHA